MQTASALEDGRWRLGAQASAAGYCGSVEGPVPTACSEYPDGVPVPELRVDARRGLPARSDVGLSLQVAPQALAAARPLQVGLTFDGKRELGRTRTGPARHVLSLGLLGGMAIAGRLGLAPFVQAEWGVTLMYGLQVGRFEWVVGGVASRRALVDTTGVRAALPVVQSTRVGLSLGLFRRSPAGWAVQLGYLGDPDRYSAGAIQVQYGVFWDLGGPARDD
jgi:hypothetical protein